MSDIKNLFNIVYSEKRDQMEGMAITSTGSDDSNKSNQLNSEMKKCKF